MSKLTNFFSIIIVLTFIIAHTLNQCIKIEQDIGMDQIHNNIYNIHTNTTLYYVQNSSGLFDIKISEIILRCDEICNTSYFYKVNSSGIFNISIENIKDSYKTYRKYLIYGMIYYVALCWFIVYSIAKYLNC